MPTAGTGMQPLFFANTAAVASAVAISLIMCVEEQNI